MDIIKRLENLKKEINNSPNAKLLLVTKYAELDDIKKVYDHGERAFAENYVQRLMEKVRLFPEDVNWHMIGHIQTNKVKYLAKIPNLAMIHSVDSIKLVKEIEKRFDRDIDALVEINLSGENSKSGIEEDKVFDFFEELKLLDLKKINIKGLMTISPLKGDLNEKEKCFIKLKNLKKEINTKYKKSRINLLELSMGMTGDYKLALKHDATYLRIGSLIFS